MNDPSESFRLLTECQNILDALASAVTRAALNDRDVTACEPHIRDMAAALYRAQAAAALAINGQKASNDNA